MRQGANTCQVPGQAVSRPNQEVAGANGRVADLEGENCVLTFLTHLTLDGLLNDGVKGGVEQALHERVWCVVGTRSLPLVTGELCKREAGAVRANLRRECQKALIYPAKLLGTKILVVHGPQYFALTGESEMAQSFEKVMVRQLSMIEVGGESWIPKEASEGRQSQILPDRREDPVAGERTDQKLELLPKVSVAAALDF